MSDWGWHVSCRLRLACCRQEAVQWRKGLEAEVLLRPAGVQSTPVWRPAGVHHVLAPRPAGVTQLTSPTAGRSPNFTGPLAGRSPFFTGPVAGRSSHYQPAGRPECNGHRRNGRPESSQKAGWAVSRSHQLPARSWREGGGGGSPRPAAGCCGCLPLISPWSGSGEGAIVVGLFTQFDLACLLGAACRMSAAGGMSQTGGGAMEKGS